MKRLTLMILMILTACLLYGQMGNLEKVKNSFTHAKTTFPSNAKIDSSKKLTEKGKETLKKLRQLIIEGSEISPSKITMKEFMSINARFDSIMNTLGINMIEKNSTAKVRRPSFRKDIVVGGFGNEMTCTDKCNEIYNTCMSENDCTRNGWVCFCCAPCSIVYATCMASCHLD
jgi:hypothetical protein